MPIFASGFNHPRLFFSREELTVLRDRQRDNIAEVVYDNLIASAEWCLTRPLRSEWIAPISPDPIHANLYDRFYAMMHDMAVMEHLAFTWSYTQEERYGTAAVNWALAACRVWRREAEGQPDGGKAYAATRLLKALAVSYDLLYDRLSPSEREELQKAIIDIGQAYYNEYFTLPHVSGRGFYTHHAIVEWASFGLAALALLDEYEPAAQWLSATVDKFRNHLLPKGISPDGAQIEGTTFWASTMQYRLIFMDALRRVTGEDLFRPFSEQMTARLALASIAAPKEGGYDQTHETVILSPSYGQINYYAPVLLALAREYQNSLYQHLALWDQSIGSLQKSRYITNNGEWMLFGWGGYAYAWYDSNVPAVVTVDAPLSFEFPSVNEAYLRDGYHPGGVTAGIRNETVVIHAGGRPVFVGNYQEDNDTTSPPASVLRLEDNGARAKLICTAAESGVIRQTIMLKRPGLLTLTRHTDEPQSWWFYNQPAREENRLVWPDGTILEVTRGSIISLDPAGYHEEKVVGNGLLHLQDPLPMSYPLVRAQPQDGLLVIEIQTVQPSQ